MSGSTPSKNRHGRFAEGEVLCGVFELGAWQNMKAGLVGAAGALGEGSTVEVDANRDSPNRTTDAWDTSERISRPLQAYLDDLDAADPLKRNRIGAIPKGPKDISKTNPSAAGR